MEKLHLVDLQVSFNMGTFSKSIAGIFPYTTSEYVSFETYFQISN